MTEEIPKKRKAIRILLIAAITVAVIAVAWLICLHQLFGHTFEGFNMLEAVNSN